MFIAKHIDRSGWVFLAIIALVVVAAPAMNLLAEPGSFFHVPTYAVGLIGKYLTYALLALSVDLIWGYCGILSLGHGAFFALGGLFVAVTLFLPKGILGTLQAWWSSKPKQDLKLTNEKEIDQTPPLAGAIGEKV